MWAVGLKNFGSRVSRYRALSNQRLRPLSSDSTKKTLSPQPLLRKVLASLQFCLCQIEEPEGFDLGSSLPLVSGEWRNGVQL